MDNILIFSCSIEEHKIHLGIVFESVRAFINNLGARSGEV
jgi:hypothetical protein